MTDDNIIRMAREADQYANRQTNDEYDWKQIRDEHFAALVAAVVREECLRACKAYRYDDGDGQHIAWYSGIDGCIEAIRARGQS